MKSFFVLLAAVLVVSTAGAQRPQRAEELRQVLQQTRPATPPPQLAPRTLSDEERAELRRQLAEARDTGRSARHSLR